MNTVAAHQRVMRPVPHTTSGAGLAVIASLLLELAGASMAAPPPDRRASRPLVFEANRGQADAQVQFVARGAGYTAFLTSTETVLQLGAHATVHLKPVGVDPAARILGDGELPGVVNYFRQEPSTAISAPTYRAVRSTDVKPDVDLVYYGSRRRLEYDLVVAPGADPDRIGFGIDGAERVEVDGEGALVVHTTAGDVRQPRPVACQRIGGVRRPVAADYALDAEGRVRLRLGAYDRSRRLVIDPVITYATYLGGTGDEARVSLDGEVHLARDGAGNVYLTGTTRSTDFPTTAGPYRMLDGSADVFVTKLSPAGAVLYSTYLGGPCEAYARDIAIDAAGNVYVAGTTASSDFPLVDPIELSRGGGVVGLSGFVSKLSPDGSQLLYSTYLGGSGSAVINGIALDGDRNVYVTGETESVDFPTTPGGIQEHPGKRHCIEGCTDAFVSKIAPSGSALVYSTYLYGEVDDAGNAIAVDGSGNAYVMGTTNSGLFPILHAFQHVDRGLADAFVVELNPDATRLVYSSYLGGSRSGSSPSTGSDTGTDIVLDEAGNAYVAGYTLSFDLPTTPDALQPNLGGGVCDYFGRPCGDAFLAKISAGGPGVTPAIRLTVNPADAAPGGTIVATWAGNPTPTASDYLRLFALGSAGEEFDDVVIGWSTPGAAAGQLSLLLPADLPVGSYELRLLSPAPGSSLPVPIAR